MCNSRPVYRAGEALELRRTGADGKPVGDLINLSGDQAVELGEEFIAHETEICDDLTAHIIELAPTVLSEVSGRKADARLNFTYGVIVDLQNTVFETKNFRHHTRVCVTICQHGTKSKIWFRSQCSQYRPSESADWDVAVDMTEAHLEAFFDEAHDLGEVALDAVQELYDERLQSYIGAALNGTEMRLRVANRFEFKTFDSDSPRLESLFEDLKTGQSFTRTLEANLEERPKALDPAMTAVKIALPGQDDLRKALVSLRSDAEFSIVDHATAIGDIGVFVRHCDGPSCKNSTHQVFCGATYDPEAHNRGKRNSDSPAFRVAAEMLATVTAEV